jgi:glycosyltransferase involved in cell wall biosynthesis
MNFPIFISVVIPTYNRSIYLSKILNILKKNFKNFKFFEIIICDSDSKDCTKKEVIFFQKNNAHMYISYINLKKNNHSMKRNIGIKKARGKYIVLLDDDCFPEENFLRQYYYLLERFKYKKKNIYCGSVKYPKFFLKDNFVKYRKSRHFVVNKKYSYNTYNLTAKNIVTMNMAFNKEIILKNKILFNEKFNKYGFEDYEFAFRLINSGFKLFPSSPLVFHCDSRSFQKYLFKLKFLGFESASFLAKLNYPAAINNNFYKLEKNFIIKILIKNKLFRIFLEIFEKLALKIDKNFIYLPLIYKYAFAGAYLQGCISKFDKNISQNIKYQWYK